MTYFWAFFKLYLIKLKKKFPSKWKSHSRTPLHTFCSKEHKRFQKTYLLQFLTRESSNGDPIRRKIFKCKVLKLMRPTGSMLDVTKFGDKSILCSYQDLFRIYTWNVFELRFRTQVSSNLWWYHYCSNSVLIHLSAMSHYLFYLIFIFYYRYLILLNMMLTISIIIILFH